MNGKRDDERTVTVAVGAVVWVTLDLATNTVTWEVDPATVVDGLYDMTSEDAASFDPPVTLDQVALIAQVAAQGWAES